MADEPGIELEARITDIQESLSLWSQLPNHDKKQFKALVDQKIYALAHYARDKDTKKSKFLKRSLELHKTLWTAKFDLKSVEALISEEVERTMLEAGLQYEEASTSVKSTILSRLRLDIVHTLPQILDQERLLQECPAGISLLENGELLHHI